MNSGAVHAHYKDLTIKHFNITVPVVTVGKAAYFPLKTLCERMGINPQWQVDKVRRLSEEDSRYAGALRMLPVPTNGGPQPTQCLNRRHLGRWLDSLDPAKCAITARGPLERLQPKYRQPPIGFCLGIPVLGW